MKQPDQPYFFEKGIATNQREYSLAEVPVKGKFPDWLTGHYVRNGPGMYNLPNRRMNHWFDAMGALHRFGMSNGKVDYTCRYIHCYSYDHVKQHGELKYSEFATDPCRSLFKKIQSHVFPTRPNMTDNPKVHVAKINDKFVALGETPMQVEFDIHTLKAVGVSEIVPGAFAYKTTAHPHFDQHNAYNLVVKFGMQSYYKIYNMATPGGKPIATIPVKKPAYLHGFGMSKKYFIIAAGPLVAVPLELLFWKRPYIENHKWLPKEGSSIWVIKKSTGKLAARFETEAFFSSHHVNAWEEGDELVMDINAYDDASIVEKYYLKELEKPGTQLPFGTLRRYRMNLRSKKIPHHTVSEACIELPRIDYDRYNTSPDYTYTYGVSLLPGKRDGFYNSIVKINARNGDTSYWNEEYSYPGEPCFIPRPGSRNDDDGVLLSIVLDAKKKNSFLLLLDAGSMTEIARAAVPEAIVYGFHAEFFSENSLS